MFVSVCLCVAAPLRYNTMTIIWICMALLSGLVTCLAIFICRKRQGYTLPHYPSLLCVEHFLTLLYCAFLCVMLLVMRTDCAMCFSLRFFSPEVVTVRKKRGFVFFQKRIQNFIPKRNPQRFNLTARLRSSNTSSPDCHVEMFNMSECNTNP